MTRLVLINNKDKTLTVYEGRVPLATYVDENFGTAAPTTKEEIEQIRMASYLEKA